MASTYGGGILVEYMVMFLLTLLKINKFRMSNVDLITSVVDFVVVGFLYARPKLLEIFFVCRALRMGRWNDGEALFSQVAGVSRCNRLV